jgi:hypothetical protein
VISRYAREDVFTRRPGPELTGFERNFLRILQASPLSVHLSSTDFRHFHLKSRRLFGEAWQSSVNVRVGWILVEADLKLYKGTAIVQRRAGVYDWVRLDQGQEGENPLVDLVWQEGARVLIDHANRITDIEVSKVDWNRYGKAVQEKFFWRGRERLDVLSGPPLALDEAGRVCTFPTHLRFFPTVRMPEGRAEVVSAKGERWVVFDVPPRYRRDIEV